MELVKLTIDGIEVEVPKGTTVLEAARKIGVEIPTLCYLKEINKVGACRVCVVEVGPRLLASCTLEAENGMHVKTNTQKVREARRAVVELILSNHKRECTTCIRSENCELQSVSKELNIRDLRFEGEKTHEDIDSASTSVVRDPEKCILCGRCIATCSEVQTVHAIGFARRGFNTKVAPTFNRALANTVCVNCGQCIMACPVGALYEKENIKEVWRAISNPEKFVVVQTAPAVRVALGEEFGMPIGTRVTGKMVAALRRVGFDKVFDTDFGADLTIMEEGTELISRLNKGENLPLMTSCCPGWVKFVEHYYPEMIDNLSTCKSPSEMEGALIKSYFAAKMGIDPKNIVTVSIMPCVGKKFEGQREELSHEGMQDVDIVLTTRELAQMIKEAGIDFKNLPDEQFDNPFGEGTGAAVIFGATGGVAEAALRTVYEVITGNDLDNVEITAVRGVTGIKEAVIDLNGRQVKAAIAHGLSNARRLLDMIKSGERQYDFIEVMACPGGCVTGGGQPIVDAKTREKMDVRVERAKAIYEEDRHLPIRKSHKNPDITRIYEEFLGQPNSHKSHELLHTHYVKRDRF
ncbi:NADP-reducing hydrogenase subunit HndC [Caloramator mitchellensis]|uniref:NADP-reducing hydrogenase subunit HndC n=1 Tax=Caloramator mitchellensis TaxID=908809 RepID=A0A0R3JX57_CALMK|nr:NADH-dependent [FeFe] hydrogenase, group A6 [Caloramator mitchellensis]KRQ88137.1 NADP-reducing hydrogenase subunit HndC [Caloramator mitchellensis]